MEDDWPDVAPTRGRLHPVVRLALGLLVGGAALWLVVSTAGGISDALDAVWRMRLGFVALAVALTAVRIGLYTLQLMWLGRRSGPLGVGAASGLALVIYGAGPVSTDVGSIDVPVEIDAGIRPGVVSLPHGWGHDQPGTRLGVAAERPGINMNIVLDTTRRDTVTGTAALNCTPVRVSPATLKPPSNATERDSGRQHGHTR